MIYDSEYPNRDRLYLEPAASSLVATKQTIAIRMEP